MPMVFRSTDVSNGPSFVNFGGWVGGWRGEGLEWPSCPVRDEGTMGWWFTYHGTLTGMARGNVLSASV